METPADGDGFACEDGRFPWYELSYPRRGGKLRAYVLRRHRLALVDKSLAPAGVRRLAGERVARVVSRFPLCDEVTRKCSVARMVERAGGARSRYLTPETFCVPSEAEALAARVGRVSSNTEELWILKPTNGSVGQGIRVVRRGGVMEAVREITQGVLEEEEDTHVVQRYVENPALVAGRKFDLRVYGLLVRPASGQWRSYMCKEGYARVSKQAYSADTLEDMDVHVTNRCFPKEEYFKKAPLIDKLQMSAVLSGLVVEGGHRGVWEQLKSSTGRMLALVSLDLMGKMDLATFPGISFYQLFGLDFLVDAAGRVHLMEINSNPNMGAGSPVDIAAKAQAVAGALDLVMGPGTGKDIVLGCLSGTQEGVQSQLFAEGGIFGTDERARDARHCYEEVTEGTVTVES